MQLIFNVRTRANTVGGPLKLSTPVAVPVTRIRAISEVHFCGSVQLAVRCLRSIKKFLGGSLTLSTQTRAVGGPFSTDREIISVRTYAWLLGGIFSTDTFVRSLGSPFLRFYRDYSIHRCMVVRCLCGHTAI